MTAPELGTLSWIPAAERPDLLGEPVAAALASLTGPAWVAEIDDDLADTASRFCRPGGRMSATGGRDPAVAQMRSAGRMGA